MTKLEKFFIDYDDVVQGAHTRREVEGEPIGPFFIHRNVLSEDEPDLYILSHINSGYKVGNMPLVKFKAPLVRLAKVLVLVPKIDWDNLTEENTKWDASPSANLVIEVLRAWMWGNSPVVKGKLKV
jgi:hypothetical protein